MFATARRSFPVALLVLTAVLTPVAAQDEQALTLSPLPVSSAADTFYVFGMPGADTQLGQDCLTALANVVDETMSTQVPYAVNNADDPCALDGTPEGDNAGKAFRASLLPTLTGTAQTITIFFAPAMPDDVELRDGASVKGRLNFAYTTFNEDAAVVFGAARPVLSLESGGEVVATWDEAPEVIEEFQSPGPQKYWWNIEFDMGAVTLNPGPLKLHATFTNDPANQTTNMLASRVELDVRPDKGAEIVIPFANDPPETDDEGGAEGNNTTTGDGNQTTGPDGNQTDTGNETVDPANNTTAPDAGDAETGFLPGFELTSLLAAGMVAALALARRRPGRP